MIGNSCAHQEKLNLSVGCRCRCQTRDGTNNRATLSSSSTWNLPNKTFPALSKYTKHIPFRCAAAQLVVVVASSYTVRLSERDSGRLFTLWFCITVPAGRFSSSSSFTQSTRRHHHYGPFCVWGRAREPSQQLLCLCVCWFLLPENWR